MAKKSQKKKQGVALPQLNLPKVDLAGMIDGVTARFSGNKRYRTFSNSAAEELI